MLQTEQIFLTHRPRRNRKMPAIRELIAESHLKPSDLVVPFFLIEGDNQQEEIPELPGVYRYTVDLVIEEAAALHRDGIQAIALFPVLDAEVRDEEASASRDPEGLIPWAVRLLKKELPTLTIIADVALDPYTSHGHDGIVDDQMRIDNDRTLAALGEQALVQAEAGVDIIAPSDMMDGRVKYLREILDDAGFTETTILSYCAKYASSLYNPFRSAINTELSFGDKRTYQMDPANVKEALLEAKFDEAEGADMLLVKPASLYLDVVAKMAESTSLPVGAYHVSGEYAMVMAADRAGLLDASAVFYETLLSIKRAGARFIFTYAANHVLPILTNS
ncbi:MAG: porphobilinogen synthase [Simkaniaceae bacterium]|nr:porphobilinogen synthase [Simkaniaceae bacterium]